MTTGTSQSPTRWQRWIESPWSTVAAVAVFYAGFVLWGLFIDDQTIGDALTAPLIATVIFAVIMGLVAVMQRRSRDRGANLTVRSD